MIKADYPCSEALITREVVVSSISSAAIPWIMLASVGVACVSAYFSWRSSEVAANGSQATLYLKFQEQYASGQMLQDLRNLRSWREKYGPDFASRWAKQYEQNNPEALAVNESRRRVSHFYGAIADLYRNGLLSEPRLLTNFQGIDLWFEVVEPLEKALNPDYDKSQFDALYSLNGSSGRGQPRWFRPVIKSRSSDAK